MREQGKSLGKAIRTALAVGALCLFVAPAAQAADGIYFGNFFSGKLAFAPLAGGHQDLDTGPGVAASPSGVAIDPATDRIYWASTSTTADKISFANLDGSGGGTLNTAGAFMKEPRAVAIDPVGRRIYWGSNSASAQNKISYANLDGSGGGTLNLNNAHEVSGLAVDPVAHRLYWANEVVVNGEAIGFVNLDGGGEGILPVTGAEAQRPYGLAIDPALGRIYWSNLTLTAHISYANLDGSGGGNLDTTGATTSFPEGVAVDPLSGRAYWANLAGSTIGSTAADGSGGGADIGLGSAVEPDFPLLAVAPRATAAPAITGGALAGSALTCSQGGWAPDSTESFFYAAPHSFAFQWSVDGVDIPGATQSTLTAGPKGGDYRCRVSAGNHAGTTAQTSAAHHVAAAPTPPVTKPGGGGGSGAGGAKLSLALATKKVPAKGPVSIAVRNESSFAVGGTLTGLAFRWAGGARKDPPMLATVHFKAPANGKAIVKLKLPKLVQAALAAGKSVSLKLSAAFNDGAGKAQTLNKTLVVRAAAKARR